MNRDHVRQWCNLYSQVTAEALAPKPLIMGVLNVTPDSFSDGGRYYELSRAIDRAHQMIEEGADIIDLGGETSKPGSTPVSCAEEMARVIPVIERLRAESDVCISIDTTKAQVMHAAVKAGASMINDISALSHERALAVAAALDVPVCLMHMQGEPQTMQDDPQYPGDVVDEINFFFQRRIEVCIAAGIKRKNLILDPGFGFGKTPQHNLRLVNQISRFQEHCLPVLLGVSRKNTLGLVLGRSVNERLFGGLAMAVFAVLHGAAMIRTHDVDETRQVLKMVSALKNDHYFVGDRR